MGRLISIPTIVCILNLTGCATSDLSHAHGVTAAKNIPIAQRELDTSLATAKGMVGVALYRQKSVPVPVKISGGTLREVVNYAKDSAGVTEIEKYMVNNQNGLFNSLGVPKDAQKALSDVIRRSMYADQNLGVISWDEIVAISDSNSIVFVPMILIQNTALGQMKIGPGASVASMTRQHVNNLIKNNSVPSERVNITLSGMYMASSQLRVPSDSRLSMQTIDQLLDYSKPLSEDMGDRAELNVDTTKLPLGPNILVVSSQIQGIPVLHILPAPDIVTVDDLLINDLLVNTSKDPSRYEIDDELNEIIEEADIDEAVKTQLKEEIQDTLLDAAEIQDLINLQFQQGDHLHLTRIESLPFVNRSLR